MPLVRQPLVAALALCAASVVTPALAQVSGTWAVNTPGNWSTAANWSSNPQTPGAGGVATFGSALASAQTVTVNTNPSLTSLAFNNAAASYTLAASGSNAITLVPTVLGDLPTLNVIAGTHFLNAPLAGSSSLTKIGAGTLVLGGASTYTGNTAVNAGVLRVTSNLALGPAGPSNSVGAQGTGVIELSGGISLGSRDVGVATSATNAPNGAIRSVAGANSIGGNVFLLQSPAIGVDAGSTLTLTGELIDNGIFGSSTLHKVGAGTLEVRRFGGVSSDTTPLPIGTLNLAAGLSRVTPGGTNASTSRVRTLTIDSGATLDLSDNALVIDYTSASPINDVRTLLSTGRVIASGVGAKRIGFAEAARVATGSTYAGQPVDSTAVVARAVVAGDSDLSGAVDFDDLLSLAQHYQLPGTWADGDFNYDNAVDFEDLLALAQNYGAAGVDLGQLREAGVSADWALARSLVPEPALWGVMAGLIGPMAVRSRKSCARLEKKRLHQS